MEKFKDVLAWTVLSILGIGTVGGVIGAMLFILDWYYIVAMVTVVLLMRWAFIRAFELYTKG